MNKTIEVLRSWGCDIQGVMDRLGDDEAFYVDCLNALLVDPSLTELQEAIKQQDTKAAFDAAHTLKGVLGNLGLTPMYTLMRVIVELLRSGNYEGAAPQLEQFWQMEQKLREILQG